MVAKKPRGRRKPTKTKKCTECKRRASSDGCECDLCGEDRCERCHEGSRECEFCGAKACSSCVETEFTIGCDTCGTMYHNASDCRDQYECFDCGVVACFECGESLENCPNCDFHAVCGECRSVSLGDEMDEPPACHRCDTLRPAIYRLDEWTPGQPISPELLVAAIELCKEGHVRGLALCDQDQVLPRMRAAHEVIRQAAYKRMPELDGKMDRLTPAVQKMASQAARYTREQWIRARDRASSRNDYRPATNRPLEGVLGVNSENLVCFGRLPDLGRLVVGLSWWAHPPRDRGGNDIAEYIGASQYNSGYVSIQDLQAKYEAKLKKRGCADRDEIRASLMEYIHEKRDYIRLWLGDSVDPRCFRTREALLKRAPPKRVAKVRRKRGPASATAGHAAFVTHATARPRPKGPFGQRRRRR